MFGQKYHQVYHKIKKPKTLLLASRKSQIPSSTLLLTTFNKTFKKHQSDHSLNHIPTPIHTSLHLDTHRQTSFLKKSENKQLPQSQKVIKARIMRNNQFNHRTFSEQSPTKQSLFFKNLKKKGKSRLAKNSFQAIIQSTISKKKIASKQQSMRQSQLFWDSIRQKIQKQQMQNSLIEVKKVNQKQQKLKKQFNKIIPAETSCQYLKKYGKPKKSHNKMLHKRFLTSFQQNLEVRPWNHTRRILTSFSGEKSHSIRSQQEIEEHL